MGALLVLALAAQDAGVPAAPPASGWVRVRTPVGTLVTDAPAAQAQRAAVRLQRFAQVLRAAAPVEPVDTREAVLLAFADEDTFNALRPGHGGRAHEVDGFVQGGSTHTMVAVNLAARRADPWETLDHEYVHLALNGALPAQPLWIAEGLAELYSSWAEDEAGVRAGGARPEHVRLLRERRLLPMERVLAAGYTTPEFLDPTTRSLLYAQSWALVRMVEGAGDAAARERLLDFLRALAGGDDAPTAFARAFGYGVAEAESRLLRWLASDGPPALALTLPPAMTGLPAVEAAPPGVAQALIGELLLRQDRDTDARRRLDAALREDPALAAAHESLAHLALRRGRWSEARQHLQGALERQRDTAPALYRMADLVVREAAATGQVLSDAAEETAVRLLERAVALAPYSADAVELLAHLRPEPRGQRIHMVEQALARNPGRADLAFTLAGLRLGAQDPRGAAAALVRARDSTRDEAQRFLSEHLLRRLGQTTAGTVETTGRLTHLECRPGGALDFVVEAQPGTLSGGIDLVLRGSTRRPAAGPRLLRLRAATPTAVLLQDGSGDLLQREIVCGPQQGAVRVRYRPVTDPTAGPPLDGVLLTLRFVAG